MADPAGTGLGMYVVVQIIKDVGTQTYRILTARSAVEWHAKKLRLTQLDAVFWDSRIDGILQHAGTIPEERLLAIRANGSELKKATEEYDKGVKRWCKRLSVDASNLTGMEDVAMKWSFSEESLVDATEKPSPEQVKKSHRISNQGRSFSLPGRVGFALYGEYLIKEQAQKVSELQNSLSSKCIAESSFASSVPTNTGVAAVGRESKLMQFVARAKERVRTEAPIKIFRIHVPDAQYKYADGDFLDPQMEDHPIPEYALPRVSLVPLPHAAEQGPEPFEHCIAVCRSPLLAISDEHYESEAAKLARLFAEDEEHAKCFLAARPDTDVLRCCCMVLYPGQACDLLFKLPPGSNPHPSTLRQVLTDPLSASPIHPLSDRIRFCIRIVAGLLIVHSLGLVHKRVHPETIVVVEPLGMKETDVYPYKLGHPYLTSLQLARTDDGKTKKLKYEDAIIHRGIYVHPRDQYIEPGPGKNKSERRLDEYRQRDDIFSTGICLFEVMCFRSLLVWKEKPEVRFPDYVYDDTFVPLSDSQAAWKDLSSSDRAKRRATVLIDHVREKVPAALGRRVGKRAAEIVVSFLRAGYEDEAFGVSLRDRSEAEASLYFLNQALRSLREIYRELVRKEKKKKRNARTWAVHL